MFSNRGLLLFRLGYKSTIVRTSRRSFSNAKVVSFFFEDAKGEMIAVKGKVGDSILEVAEEHGMEIESACGAECACSMCLVYLTDNIVKAVPKETEEEMDMLDLVDFEDRGTPRLGCQVMVTDKFEGEKVRLPTSHSLA